jgi:hypothetical protein
MTKAEVQAILEGVTEEILDRMRESGFHVEFNVITGDPEDELRFDPIPWDVNNGHCEAWAERAAELIPGALAAWIDPVHCVLVYDGLFYDADWTAGARHWNQLPMFSNAMHERPEP